MVVGTYNFQDAYSDIAAMYQNSETAKLCTQNAVYKTCTYTGAVITFIAQFKKTSVHKQVAKCSQFEQL